MGECMSCGFNGVRIPGQKLVMDVSWAGSLLCLISLNIYVMLLSGVTAVWVEVLVYFKLHLINFFYL